MGKIQLISPHLQWSYIFVSLLETYFIKSYDCYSVQCHYTCAEILTWSFG